ncbi:MAG: hypothetical protein AAF206_28370 [Bacteroidota bacterium]
MGTDLEKEEKAAMYFYRMTFDEQRGEKRLKLHYFEHGCLSLQVVLDIIRSHQEDEDDQDESQQQTLNLKIRGSFPKDMAMIQFQIEFLDKAFQPVDIWNASASSQVCSNTHSLSLL